MSKAKENNLALSKECAMYEPCPLCFKCMVKATHLYERCVSCEVQFCGHNNKQRNIMIKRENFAIDVTNETGKLFKEQADRVLRAQVDNDDTCRCHEQENEYEKS